MGTTALPTPLDLSITPRDRRFGRDGATPRLWHGGQVEATAIYNALSSTFPIGEAYFVESVRAFREGTPPKLADEIKAFTTQEAIHSREHDAFNKRASDAGYDLTKLEAQVEKRLAVARARGPYANLAATMAEACALVVVPEPVIHSTQMLAEIGTNAANLVELKYAMSNAAMPPKE